MAGLSTSKGKIVSFDDVDAILDSVDSGQPFQVHVVSSPIENGQKRAHLQIRNCTEVSSDTTKIGSDNNKHANEPHDGRALVKQLRSLQLTDKGILEQILTSTQPAALSELTAAHNNKSMIPLVTAKDGRVFSILAGQLAYSNWAGKYPMEFSQGPVRKLSDPTLAADKITTYQNNALMRMVEAVSHTEDSREFRKSVQSLRPKIWDHYKMLIAEPVDLESMHLMLLHKRYATMADFQRHVDLLEQNARTYNGDRNTSITAAAKKVRSDFYRRMDEIPAEPPGDGKVATQIRQIIFVDNARSGSAADSDNEDTSVEEATGSKPEARDPDGRNFVLPLGRLCVSRNAGDHEFVVTPYIVLMDLQSADKALCLIKDNYTPVGLPRDKEALLDFGGKYNFTMGILADSIEDWKIRRIPGPRGGLNSTQVPVLSWASVEKLIQLARKDTRILFDRVETRQEAAAVIEKGWKESIKITGRR
ncbi:transcription initiation at TATA-containing promoter protein [Diaporthe eres]|uniref:Transcription initiation at TATA-containing promoter protein n=1 Tax=Diaporthe eres TaxID=83184 RepID=A0ABR1PAD8_DIAER